MMMMSNFDEIKTVYLEDHDPGDAWGSVMGAFFDVAEELHARGEDCPASWEFRPASYDPADVDEREPTIATGVDTDVLIDFGNWLEDCADALQRNGLDY